MRNIEDWIDRYRTYLKRRGYARRSQDSYYHILQQFLAFLDEQDLEDASQIDRQMITEYQTHLYTHIKPDGRPLALKTQSMHLTVINGFLRYLVKEGALLLNPADGLEFPQFGPRNPPKDVPTPGEVEVLLIAPDTTTYLGVRDRAILEVLYSTGIRISELINLKVYDVDLVRGLVTVIAGKGGKDRVTPLGSQAIEAVKTYIEKVRPRYRSGTETSILFLSRRGQPMFRSSVGLFIHRYTQQARIERKITPHSLRHACATHMLQGEASIRHIQELLGHKQLSTTQLYTQVVIDDLKAVHKRTHPREREPVKPVSDPESDS